MAQQRQDFTAEVAEIAENSYEKAASKGVLWAHMGFFPATASSGKCNCLASYFAVDLFGRTFCPDAGMCRVSMLDTNGNVIGHFGRYGNRDAVGKEDYVPLATPIAVAASERYLYVGDINNHCLARVKIGYAAEETCEVK